jgi:Protein of unknown function (DUF3433)
VDAQVPETITTKKTTNPGVHVSTIVTATSTASVHASPTITGSAPLSAYVSTLATSFSTSMISSTRVGTTTSSITSTDAQGRATTVTTAVPFTTVAQIPTVVAHVDYSSENDGTSVVVVLTFSKWLIFYGGYLPVILSIIFKVFWTAIYAKVKLIEPFTQLARPQGAVAANTLHTYYLSSNLTPDPLVSFLKGHWLVFWTSVVYVAVGFLAPFASEVLFLDTHYCEVPNPDQPENPCWPPRLTVDPLVVRILQGLLSYIGVMTLTIMMLVLRCSTGLYSDPSSIGAVASMMHHPEVLSDFRSMDDDIALKDMRKYLGDKRYALQEYQRPNGVWRYGFVPVTPTIPYGGKQLGMREVPKAYSKGTQRQKVFGRISDGAFAILLFGLLGVVVAYYKDGSDSAFNRFFNSNTFGPRFFMVCLLFHASFLH